MKANSNISTVEKESEAMAFKLRNGKAALPLSTLQKDTIRRDIVLPALSAVGLIGDVRADLEKMGLHKKSEIRALLRARDTLLFLASRVAHEIGESI